ncbi:hypothetical protein ACRJ4W_20695 [Streptomyces sp. GLT-R25]
MSSMPTTVTTVITGLVANRPPAKPVSTPAGNTNMAPMMTRIEPKGFAVRRSNS